MILRSLWGFTLIFCLSAAEQPPLRLKNADSAGLDYLPHRAYSLKRLEPGRVHVVIRQGASARGRSGRRLVGQGLRFLQPVPDHGWLVSVPAGADLRALGAGEAFLLAPEQKLSRLLAAGEHPQTILVEFHPDVGPADAETIVLREGAVLVPNPDLRRHHLLVRATRKQAERLAEWDEVAYVFPASWDLRSGLPAYACAGALTVSGPVGQYVATIGPGWDGPGLGRAELTYCFERLTERLPREDAVREIRRAMGEWARYIDLRLAPAASPYAPRSINFLFARADHGDGYPFDGPGRILAHTFYPAPPNPEPIAGDVHLDDDETWRVGAHVDLFSVVLHELGHALGLGHADDPTAVMYPYYRQVTGLAELDIASIRQLYAPAPAPEPPGPPPPAPPGDPGPAPDPPRSDPGPPSSPGPSPPNPPPSEDRTAPSLAITSPAASSVYTSDPSIALRGTARDNVGVVRLTWTSSTSGTGPVSGTGYWVTPPIPLLAGINTITIRAWDAAGNMAWRSVVVTRR